MDFQLVRASDDEIVIWHTVHGHIYVYGIEPRAARLTARSSRSVPDAELDAATFNDDALAFATGEARKRHLLG